MNRTCSTVHTSFKVSHHYFPQLLSIIRCVSQLTVCDLYYFLFSQTEHTQFFFFATNRLSLFISLTLTTWFTPLRFSLFSYANVFFVFVWIQNSLFFFIYIKFIFNLNDEKVEGKGRNIKFVYQVFLCVFLLFYIWISPLVVVVK